MNGKGDRLDQILDRAVEEIRDSRLTTEEADAAARRVWSRIRRELPEPLAGEGQPRPFRDCSDFQALLPAYLDDELEEGKLMLMRDHLGECVPCRRMLKQLRQSRRAQGPRTEGEAQGRRFAAWGWRVAAAAAVFVALIGLSVRTERFAVETGGLIRIETIEGQAFGVEANSSTPLSVGDAIRFEDVDGIRTGKGSNATLRLADDSLVEMNERSELAVKQRRTLWSRGPGDTVIDLRRGSIIVEAAKREAGRLSLDTDDCRVSVKGTVFAVNHGYKGSRVSVVEGQVQVKFAGGRQLLEPGEQVTTSAGLNRVPLEQELAWSRNLDQHLALLRELTRVGREIEADLPGPKLRFSTELLDRAPENTVVFVALPNVSSILGEGYEALLRKVAESDVLLEWWQASVSESGVEEQIDLAVRRIREYGSLLGEEIVVTLQRDPSGGVHAPLVYARVTDSPALIDLVRADSNRRTVEVDGPEVRILEELEAGAAGSGGDRLYLWAHEGWVALSTDPERIARLAGELGSRGEFRGSAFHARLAELYGDGVQWLVGFDLETMIAGAQHGGASPDPSLEQLGLTDLRHAFGQRRGEGGHHENRLVLTFSQPRRGLASWLAEPAPVGALEFVSADTHLAGGFVMKRAEEVVNELITMLGAADEDFPIWLERFESEQGIGLREDIAAALGGEFAMALDGPLLPRPSILLVFEVYDPSRLQSTLSWAVEKLNELAREHDRRGLLLEETSARGRRYYELRSLDTGISAHYTIVDGYLVASASRGLLDRAIQVRSSGYSLLRAPALVELLPADGRAHFSAMLYQDLGPLLGPLATRLGSLSGRLSAEQQRAIDELGSQTEPALLVAYGEPERIDFVSTSRAGLLSSSLTALLRLDLLLDVPEWIGRAAAEENADAPDPDTPAIEVPREGHREG